jgi:hypothetical protein
MSCGTSPWLWITHSGRERVTLGCAVRTKHFFLVPASRVAWEDWAEDDFLPFLKKNSASIKHGWFFGTWVRRTPASRAGSFVWLDLTLPIARHSLRACVAAPGTGLATLQPPLAIAPGSSDDLVEVTFNTHAFAAGWGMDFPDLSSGSMQVSRARCLLASLQHPIMIVCSLSQHTPYHPEP